MWPSRAPPPHLRSMSTIMGQSVSLVTDELLDKGNGGRGAVSLWMGGGGEEWSIEAGSRKKEKGPREIFEGDRWPAEAPDPTRAVLSHQIPRHVNCGFFQKGIIRKFGNLISN